MLGLGSAKSASSGVARTTEPSGVLPSDLPKPGSLLRYTLPPLVEVAANYPLINLKAQLQARGPAVLKQPGWWRGLYRGVGTCAAGVLPNKAVMLAVQDHAQRPLRQLGWQDTSARVSAAALGGLMGAVILCPFEAIMTRQQLNGQAVDFTAVFRKLWAQSPRLLYRGLGVLMARDAMYAGIVLGGTAPVAQYLRRGLEERALDGAAATTLSTIAGGVVCGLGNAILTQPLDTVKTRLQAFHNEAGVGSALRAACAGKEGWRGLYRGLLPRSLRIAWGAVLIYGTQQGVDAYLGAEDGQ